VVTAEGVKPDETKIAAVANFLTPCSQKDLKAFLGLAGYCRRFIANFSGIERPSTDLLKSTPNGNGKKENILILTNLLL
jgi:hypothetical protein